MHFLLPEVHFAGESFKNILCACFMQVWTWKFIYFKLTYLHRRINPFDQSGSELLSTPYDNAAFAQNFTVRFLGSMEVKQDRGKKKFWSY